VNQYVRISLDFFWCARFLEGDLELSATESRPKILFILADDMDWQDNCKC